MSHLPYELQKVHTQAESIQSWRSGSSHLCYFTRENRTEGGIQCEIDEAGELLKTLCNDFQSFVYLDLGMLSGTKKGSNVNSQELSCCYNRGPEFQDCLHVACACGERTQMSDEALGQQSRADLKLCIQHRNSLGISVPLITVEVEKVRYIPANTNTPMVEYEEHGEVPMSLIASSKRVMIKSQNLYECLWDSIHNDGLHLGTPEQRFNLGDTFEQSPGHHKVEDPLSSPRTQVVQKRKERPPGSPDVDASPERPEESPEVLLSAVLATPQLGRPRQDGDQVIIEDSGGKHVTPDGPGQVQEGVQSDPEEAGQ
ncbi:hypothetical protein DFH07DRAFT_780889 [Mycena maculata]|uniref:Uncharacterized protein n=1 Tax=Mycena maculata TaxID=230809 RepID=A0AAD7MTQ4_9AGAR|nr:hypothetical protein DFH07DRAFT_780889 [Mycena maculata]